MEGLILRRQAELWQAISTIDDETLFSKWKWGDIEAG